VTFLSAWAGRYALPPKQLYNLVRSGQAILIFEGFDELRNAGRAFDRHEHFNALWRFAYPGTKVLFTGRPNFFIDDREKNRTLRTDPNRGAAGNAYTQLFELDRLTMSEVEIVARGFGPGFQQAIGSECRSPGILRNRISTLDATGGRDHMADNIAGTKIWPRLNGRGFAREVYTSRLYEERRRN
jgi:hypothetical protein